MEENVVQPKCREPRNRKLFKKKVASINCQIAAPPFRRYLSNSPSASELKPMFKKDFAPRSFVQILRSLQQQKRRNKSPWAEK